jgi:hypothetical protein
MWENRSAAKGRPIRPDHSHSERRIAMAGEARDPHCQRPLEHHRQPPDLHEVAIDIVGIFAKRSQLWLSSKELNELPHLAIKFQKSIGLLDRLGWRHVPIFFRHGPPILSELVEENEPGF